jgi:hypothetical protein
MTKPDHLEDTIRVCGDAILRFGMLEGDAHVTGRRVVYDPQSEEPAGYFDNGSTAEELAIVANRLELVRMITPGRQATDDANVREAIIELFMTQRHCRTLAVILKDGLGGATIYLGDEPIHIATYAAESFFRIGAGDIFSAALAYAWGEEGYEITDAADYAARCLAYFVEGPRLPLPSNAALLPTRRISRRYPNSVRILSHEKLELGALLVHTEAWMQALNCKPLVELFESEATPDKSLPALILVGSLCSYESLDELAERAGDASTKVVFWPGVSRECAQRYFPGARITGDYATALYLVLRGEIE